MTSIQLDKFRAIFDNSTEENDDNEEIEMEVLLNQQDEMTFNLVLKTIMIKLTKNI